MISNKMKETIGSLMEEKYPDMIAMSSYLFKNPELGGEEFKSSRYIADYLAGVGFKVSFPYEDIPTAFIAEYGNDGLPVIAFVAEYDALPGYGPENKPAHACGHNWIAAAMCGCGAVLKELAAEAGCKVKVIGTPAEETVGSKCDMCRLGTFDDIDIALQAHLDATSCISPAALAMNSVEFVFTGKAVHAAQFPDKGINALDAVILLFSGINAMRQQIRPDARIHGIITEGGVAVNIIPDRGVCRITFRANDRQYVKELRQRILNIAEGAAKMTGASLTYSDFENQMDDLLVIPSLVKVVEDGFASAGLDNFVPVEEHGFPGSTDIGNVSHVCPTLYCELAAEYGKPCFVHEESALEVVDSEAAHALMKKTVCAFVSAAVEIAEDPSKLAAIKKDFAERNVCEA